MLKERRRGRAAAARVASREEDMAEKRSVRVGPGSKIERPREERQGEDKAVEGKVAVEEECMPASRFLPALEGRDFSRRRASTRLLSTTSARS